MQGEGDFTPRVIWTELSKEETQYYSGSYIRNEPLNPAEEAEYQMWIDLFQKTHCGIGSGKHYFQIITEKLELKASSLRNDPRLVLNKLRAYMQQQILPNPSLRIISDPILGYVLLSDLSTLTPEQFQILCQNPQILPHLSYLIGRLHEWKAERYLTLLKIPGALAEFEKQCAQLRINLHYALSCWGNSSLDELTRLIGYTRLTLLKTRVALSHFCAQHTRQRLASLTACGVALALGSYWVYAQSQRNLFQ